MMELQATTVITYAGPPLLGAFIGYLTNKVAIRMLFRPLKAWRVLGVRVPMTPGIIPSKRHELAENIGEMVGEHLLTPTDIGAALSAERFQEHLYQLVDDRVKDALGRDLGPVITIVPKRFRAYFKVGLRTLKYQLREGLHNYVRSDYFARTVREAVLEQAETFGRAELNTLVSRESREAFYNVVDGFIARLLSGPRVERWLADYFQYSLARAVEEGKSLEDLLPGEFRHLVCMTIRNQAPQLLQKLGTMIGEPEIRDRIIKAVCEGVDNFLDTLGPMGAMAKGFFDRDSLEGKIQAYLEDKEEDLARWLQSPDLQQRVADVLTDQAQKFFQTPLQELLERVEPEQQRAFCEQAAVQVMAMLRSEGVRNTLSTLVREHLEDALDQGQISLTDFARLVLPGKSGASVMEGLVGELISLLRTDRVLRLLDKMLNSMVDRQAARPVGILQDMMPAGVRKGITDYIVLTANRMLLKEVPGLVHSLNIREMVTEKVDSLDLLRLERLLLSIMEEQFKYINLFGALLGFLIGLINLAVLQLH
jgi:uncharacterized membrane protein YheB (UPF0754 family)